MGGAWWGGAWCMGPLWHIGHPGANSNGGLMLLPANTVETKLFGCNCYPSVSEEILMLSGSEVTRFVMGGADRHAIEG